MHKLSIAAGFFILMQGYAHAVSEGVKVACKPDYVAYCNNMVVGSQELRGCMKANALKLSKVCLQALVQSGRRRLPGAHERISRVTPA